MSSPNSPVWEGYDVKKDVAGGFAGTAAFGQDAPDHHARTQESLVADVATLNRAKAEILENAKLIRALARDPYISQALTAAGFSIDDGAITDVNANKLTGGLTVDDGTDTITGGSGYGVNIDGGVFQVDAATDRVGVNMNPTEALDVTGNIRGSGSLTSSGNVTLSGSRIVTNTGTDTVTVGSASSTVTVGGASGGTTVRGANTVIGSGGANLGFYGGAATARPGAVTQTYSTTTNTVNAYTSANADASAAYTSTAAVVSDAPLLSDMNDLRARYEVLRAMTENVLQVLGHLIDSGQALNLFG